MEKKYVYLIDSLILVGTLLSIYFVYFSATAPLLFSPESDSGTGSSCVLFSFENNGPGTARIFVADNIGFENARIYVASNGLKINLETGEHYLKVEGVFDSFPKRISVEESIILKIVEDGNLYKVINAGGSSYSVSQINEIGQAINNYNLVQNCGGGNG